MTRGGDRGGEDGGGDDQGGKVLTPSVSAEIIVKPDLHTMGDSFLNGRVCNNG